MTLIKKPYPTYYYNQKSKPPRWDWQKILLFIVIGGVVVFLLTRCNVYNKLQNHSPITTSDSSKLSIACTKTFPTKPDEYDIGRVDTLPDSTAYFKALYQREKLRKQIVKDSFIYKNKYIDTYNTDFGGDWDEGYSQGLKDGVDSGRGMCKPSTKQVDTTKRHIDSALLFSLRTQNEVLSNQHIADTTKVKDRTNLAWIFGGIGVLLFIIIGFLVAQLFKKQTSSVA